MVGGSGGDRELPTDFFRDFLLETYRLFIYIFQESVKMGIPVLKIATTFIMKCMNVIAIKATSSVATDTAALVSIQVSPFTDICHLTYAKFPTFI